MDNTEVCTFLRKLCKTILFLRGRAGIWKQIHLTPRVVLDTELPQDAELPPGASLQYLCTSWFLFYWQLTMFLPLRSGYLASPLPTVCCLPAQPLWVQHLPLSQQHLLTPGFLLFSLAAKLKAVIDFLLLSSYHSLSPIQYVNFFCLSLVLLWFCWASTL